jgi:vancomycin permeability regulator SanA
MLAKPVVFTFMEKDAASVGVDMNAVVVTPDFARVKRFVTLSRSISEDKQKQDGQMYLTNFYHNSKTFFLRLSEGCQTYNFDSPDNTMITKID